MTGKTRMFSVRNFEKFQHYKDRSPPWIKLYNELLDDYAFGRLPDASKMHLIAIWLLASRSENKLPFDPVWIGKRINATTKVELDLLLAFNFIVLDQPLHNSEQDASEPLAKCLSREEGEGETEKRKRESRKRPTLDDFELDEELKKATLPINPDAAAELAHFKDHHRAKGTRIVDCRAAYRNWLVMAKKFAADKAPKGNVQTLSTEAAWQAQIVAVKRAYAEKKDYLRPKNISVVRRMFERGEITAEEAAYSGHKADPGDTSPRETSEAAA